MIENISNKKILVTGGTGFLGSHLIERFDAQGIGATILTRNAAMHAASGRQKNIQTAEIDLLDETATGKFIARFRPQIIIHLAGSTFQTEILHRVNYEASARILEAASRVGVEKILLLGTADEYGFQTSPQNERMQTNPQSSYAVSKNKAVNHALSMSAADGLPVVVLRPFTIYGIGQPARMFVSQAINSAIRNQPFEMSAGTQKRDLLFVTDFVDAMIKTLATAGVEGEIYNVGSGSSIALRDLALRIWRIVGADESLLRIGARSGGAGELHDTEADITKISEKLNWQPRVSLEEGLRITVEAAKKNLR